MAGMWKGYCYYDADTGIHIAMIDASRQKCRRLLHHPEGEVGEVGEKECHYNDDAESFTNGNTRLATSRNLNNAIIVILNYIGRRLPA